MWDGGLGIERREIRRSILLSGVIATSMTSCNDRLVVGGCWGDINEKALGDCRGLFRLSSLWLPRQGSNLRPAD